MKKSLFTRSLTMLLALCLTLSNVMPVLAFADVTEPTAETTAEVATVTETQEPTEQDEAEDPTGAAPTEAAPTEEAPTEETPTEAAPTEEAPTEETPTEEVPTEETVVEETEADAVEEETDNAPLSDAEVETVADDPNLFINTYDAFLENLKILEDYAEAYVKENTQEDATELVLNYVRTGVERYTEGLWNQFAGAEKTAFVEYVAAQDAANGTAVAALRNLQLFYIPNNDLVEFEHMFGTLNMSYNSNADDLAGWAGDLCDLLDFVVKQQVAVENADSLTADEKIEALTKLVKDEYLGVDEDDAFGQLDIYGDLDAFYLNTKIGEAKLSVLMKNYFTAELDDIDRAEFFLHERFMGLKTQDDVRNAIYNTYCKDDAVFTLEASRGLTGEEDLRKACCYAFADYLYALAGDTLTGETEEPDPEETQPDDGEGEGGEGTGGEGTGGEEEKPAGNPYYSVFSSTDSMLAPGIQQTIKYAYTADEEQIVYYLATVDVAREDVSIHANYKNNDGSTWGMARVADQMAAAVEKHTNPDDPENYVENYNAVVGVNADFFNMSTGEPSGALVMEGVKYHGVGSGNFFAILDDGTPVLGAPSEWAAYENRIVEAVGGSVFLVKNGEIVITETTNYYNSRASRTCVGITADGKVVLMVLDGRQEPFSAGGAMIELAQIMLDAGCVTAINLDGGGSTTFAAKAEGSNEVKIVNSPSDGFARSVSSSLLVVSTAKVTNEFDHALISSDYDYVTVGTALKLTAVGVSGTGNTADIPENAVWQVSDSQIAGVQDGYFMANAEGDVEVQLLVDDEVVGTKTLHVVTPNAWKFEKEAINAVYDTPTELPLIATYNGNPVAFTVGTDVVLVLENDKAGVLENLTFTGSSANNIRNVIVGAVSTADENLTASIKINLYNKDEAVFDFENATGGDKILAWNREVTNSTLEEGSVHHIMDPDGTMDIAYTFALDMTSIEIPEQLKSLVGQLPGGDDPNKTAWDFLLALAERVSVLTKVWFEVQFDKDLEIDISELKLKNDFFSLTEATLDENNKLTITVNWIDQTAAVDPATANPLCILSGVKAVPKEDAAWNDDKLGIDVSGVVHYDVYLRANALYSSACDPAWAERFDLYPFENPDVIIGGATEKGAHYTKEYTNFEDPFTLDRENRNGWYQVGDFPTYFENNEPVSGIKKVPGKEDPSSDYIYEFNEDGTIAYAFTGLVVLDDGVYYPINGAIKTGWQVITGSDGTKQYYYFDPATGKAVDGEQTIGGYDYLFENYILVRGEIVYDSRGGRYMWAGEWLTETWLEVEGKWYYPQRGGYFRTGFGYFYGPDGVWRGYAFGEDGALLPEGIYYDDVGRAYYVKPDGTYEGGKYYDTGEYPGMFELDGDLYYIAPDGVLYKDGTFACAKCNGYAANGGFYTFAEDGRMIKAGTTFTVTWVDEDGTVLETDAAVAAGAVPEFNGTEPVKAGDAQYTYTFSGWDADISKVVTKDTTFTAVYTQTVKEYTIRFLDEDGTVLQESKVAYGTLPTATMPTKEADAQYTYTFSAWDKEIVAVTGDATYTAVYEKTLNRYEITFVHENGRKLQNRKFNYGEMPAYSGVIPQKAADSEYTYRFIGWEPELTAVTGNATYKAVFKAIPVGGVKGDVTGEGDVNEIDAVYLLWHVMFPDMYPIEEGIDIDYNSDNRTDSEDAMRLLWYAAFPDTFTELLE